jgi:hypothetical protein
MGDLGGGWFGGWMVVWGVVGIAALIMLAVYLLQRRRSY